MKKREIERLRRAIEDVEWLQNEAAENLAATALGMEQLRAALESATAELRAAREAFAPVEPEATHADA